MKFYHYLMWLNHSKRREGIGDVKSEQKEIKTKLLKGTSDVTTPQSLKCTKGLHSTDQGSFKKRLPAYIQTIPKGCENCP